MYILSSCHPPSCSIQDAKIETDLHRKKTDRNIYSPSSCHPPSCSIQYGKIKTDLHRKETDRNIYIPSSCHPPSCSIQDSKIETDLHRKKTERNGWMHVFVWSISSFKGAKQALWSFSFTASKSYQRSCYNWIVLHCSFIFFCYVPRVLGWSIPTVVLQSFFIIKHKFSCKWKTT